MANANDIRQELLRLVRAQSGEPMSAGDGGALPRLNSSTGAPQNEQPAAAAGDAAANSPSAELARQLEALKRQLGAVEEISKLQAQQLEKNTRAVADSAAAQSGRSAGTVAQDIVSTVRGAGGLGVLGSPLAGLFSRLFRRGGDETPAVLPVASQPAPIREDLALPTSASGLAQVSYRGDGVPRPVAAATPSAAPVANLTIQVQTMDSRSFLDNSDQIARAVREAMLNSHALNDVIGEM